MPVVRRSRSSSPETNSSGTETDPGALERMGVVWVMSDSTRRCLAMTWGWSRTETSEQTRFPKNNSHAGLEPILLTWLLLGPDPSSWRLSPTEPSARRAVNSKRGSHRERGIR
jgi:hypothetical protein